MIAIRLSLVNGNNPSFQGLGGLFGLGEMVPWLYGG